MKKFKRVFIDPGHGGKDSGAYNAKYKLKESTVALKVGKQVKKQLKKLNPKCKRKYKFSRRTDKFVELNSRWRMANAWNADISLCIHCNSCDVQSVRGAEVYYHGANDKKIATVISKKLADGLHITNRGAKDHEFAMTKYPVMPAVLIELDFISNNDFAKYCLKKENIKELARIICKAVLSVENG